MPATLQTSLSPLTFIASSFQPPPLPPSLPIFFLSLSLSLSLVSRFPSFSPIFILQPREFSSRRDSLLLSSFFLSFLKDKRRVEKRDGGASIRNFVSLFPFLRIFKLVWPRNFRTGRFRYLSNLYLTSILVNWWILTGINNARLFVFLENSLAILQGNSDSRHVWKLTRYWFRG